MSESQIWTNFRDYQLHLTLIVIFVGEVKLRKVVSRIVDRDLVSNTGAKDGENVLLDVFLVEECQKETILEVKEQFRTLEDFV